MAIHAELEINVNRRHPVTLNVMQQQPSQCHSGNRPRGIVAVMCSLCALNCVSIGLTNVTTKADRDAAELAELEDWLDREFPLVHVANIASPIMFSDESDSILAMLSDHDIMWISGGSLSHSLSVSKNRVAKAQQLIRDNFPEIQLVSLDAPPESSNPE